MDGGAWVAQSVKHLTLDLSPDHDLRVCEIEPHIGLCAHIADPAWDCLSLPLSHILSLPLSLSVSRMHTLSQNK